MESSTQRPPAYQATMHLFNSCTFCLSVLLSLQVQAAHLDWSRGAHSPTPLFSRLRENVHHLFYGEPSDSESTDRVYRYGAQSTSSYKYSTVIRINTTSEEELAAVNAWAHRFFLDIWDLQADHVDILVAPQRLHGLPKASGIFAQLPEAVRKRGVTHVIKDLSTAVARTFPSAKYADQYQLSSKSITNTIGEGGNRESLNNVFFQEYQPLAVIVRWMKLLESMSGGLAEVVTVGHTAEGRKIYGMRLRSEKGRSHHTHRTVLITGGLHAREWISTSTVTYLIWSLLTEYKSDGIASKFLNNFDVVLVPTMNPDGYEYTWHEDRLWSKSRQPTVARWRGCYGIDLDHSFGYQWKYEESRQDPCMARYGGEEPFEALETASLADWVKNETEKNSVKFVSYIDLHSYSQQILYPFSYNCDKTPANLENMEEVAFGLAKAIRLETGELYTIASACGEVEFDSQPRKQSRVLPYSGSAIDWFHHEMKTKFTYQIKLGDTGSYGFLLPSEEIVPTGHEVYEAFKYFADFILGHNGIEKPHKADDAASHGQKHDKATFINRPQTGEGLRPVSDREELELRKRAA